MAVIQKIRNQYAKLAGFVIALALVGFLLMDAGNNLKKIFSGSEYVAKVNGEKIEPKEYAERVQELESLYEIMGNKIDDNMRAQIHNQLLNQMVFEKAIEPQMDKLGLTVTKEEEKEMISGANPDPMVMQFPYFKNPETGLFDPQMLMAFEKKQIGNSNDERVQKAYAAWETMKQFIKRQHLINKYMSMFAGGAYTPKYLTDRITKDQSTIASIRYVKVPYTSINDNEVKVTDADLNAYIQKHAAQYQIEDPTRSIEYVSFDANPSADDTAKVVTAINQLKTEFAATNDNENFVNRNSEESYNNGFVTKNTFMSQYADSIFKSPVGEVFGPYFENGAYKLAKVTEKRTLPDSVKFRQIGVAVKVKGTDVMADSAAKRRIDSIEMAIKAGADFKTIFDRYAEKPSNIPNPGEFDITLAQMPQVVKELSQDFADFLTDGHPGEKRVIKVENDNYTGYQYVELMSQEAIQPAAKIAVISKPLNASEATINAAYAKANEFAGKNANGKAFEEAVKKDHLNKLVADNIKVNDFVIPGIGASREVIRWVYDAKQGDVSQVFALDNRYIVAKLDAIRDKGLVQIDASNRPMFESQVKAEKKADLIAQKYKGVAGVDALAQSAGQQVQSLDSFNASSAYLPNLGFEPKVVGYSFYEGFKPNTMSPAIKGVDGVFFISLVNRASNVTSKADPLQMQQQIMMQSMQLKNAISSMLQETVRRNATVKYDVNNLY